MGDIKMQTNAKKVMENFKKMTAIAEREGIAFVNDSLTKIEQTVKPLTPIKTGNLRIGYRVTSARKLSTGRIVGTIRNNEYYFKYVNDGHRTRGGGYVKGKFMAQKAVNISNMTYIPKRFKLMAVNVAKKG